MKVPFLLQNIVAVMYPDSFAYNLGERAKLVGYLLPLAELSPYDDFGEKLAMAGKILQERFPEIASAGPPPKIFAKESEALAWLMQLEARFGMVIEVDLP